MFEWGITCIRKKPRFFHGVIKWVTYQTKTLLLNNSAKLRLPLWKTTYSFILQWRAMASTVGLWKYCLYWYKVRYYNYRSLTGCKLWPSTWKADALHAHPPPCPLQTYFPPRHPCLLPRTPFRVILGLAYISQSWCRQIHLHCSVEQESDGHLKRSRNAPKDRKTVWSAL